LVFVLSLLGLAVLPLLGLVALSVAPAVAVAHSEPPAMTVARLTYLTETATSTPKVWSASVSGSERKLLGTGQQPLLAPNGQSVAAGLFGTVSGLQEQGPSIVVYSASGGAPTTYLNLATATATPLAWSPDSRYLAVSLQSTSVNDTGKLSGLAVIDTSTGAVTTIAHGQIYGASFARDGSDRIVYGRAPSQLLTAPTNVYVSAPGGTGLRALSSDGRSLNPVWGSRYIAYDRERMRREAPEYQIWLTSPSGGRVRRLTHVRVGALVDGLVPLAFSAGGSRLLAEFEGQDTSGAYAVNVASGRAREVTVHGHAVQGAGISSDGSTLLIDENAFEQAPSNGRVATIPFAGGKRSKVLVTHASQGSWNG
jgi:Tol biopolymer transport system component